jgi:uncharacterized membrane protein
MGPAEIGAGGGRGRVFSPCAAALLALRRARVGDLPQQAAMHDRRAATILAAGLAIDFSALALVIGLLTTRRMDALEIVPAAALILASWVVLNLLVAIHCAHLHPPGAARSEPQLAFPGDKERVFSDFLCFSFAIGMAFEVCDAAIIAGGTRRRARAHAVIASCFNVFAPALAINAWGGLV